MNKWFLTICLGILTVSYRISGYCDSSTLIAITKDTYEKPNFKRNCDQAELYKAALFLSHLGLSIDYEQHDIELAIANWMAVPENHRLFFEEIYKKLNEQGDDHLRNALLPVLKNLSQKWSELAQSWAPNNSVSEKISFVLCNDPEEKSPAEEKREEANELFVEAAKDLVMGSVAAAETVFAIAFVPILAIEPAERAIENLSDAWDNIHESAEAYREAERLEQLEREEHSKKKDTR